MRYLACLCVLAPLSAAGQTAAPGQPGPYAVDLRAALSGVPQDPSFFPPIPSRAVIPRRGLGIELGGHVYLMRLGPSRLGIGASVMRVRAASLPEDRDGEDVTTTLTTVAPQVSLNFGSRDGWSYVSGGIGQAQVGTAGPELVLDETTASGKESTVRSLNVGGGARWFTRRHLAFSFDVRFHILSAGRGDVPTPGSTVVAASGGISLK